MTDEKCPFCRRDPYHYVDIGVGMQRVAVTCCDLSIGLAEYSADDAQIPVTRKQLIEIADRLEAGERADLALQETSLALGGTDEWSDQEVMIADVRRQAEEVAARADRAEAALRFARAHLMAVPGAENMVQWINDIERGAVFVPQQECPEIKAWDELGERLRADD